MGKNGKEWERIGKGEKRKKKKAETLINDLFLGQKNPSLLFLLQLFLILLFLLLQLFHQSHCRLEFKSLIR